MNYRVFSMVFVGICEGCYVLAFQGSYIVQ